MAANVINPGSPESWAEGQLDLGTALRDHGLRTDGAKRTKLLIAKALNAYEISAQRVGSGRAISEGCHWRVFRAGSFHLFNLRGGSTSDSRDYPTRSCVA